MLQLVSSAPSKPLLMILHQENSICGRVGQHFEARGIPLDIRRPALGEALPDTLADHAGAVIFGGPMSANDSIEAIRRETDWLQVPLRENKPFLGICLGAQMLALKLGARVAPHPDGMAEVGYYPIRPTAVGRSVVPQWPSHVYQWHREGFGLPSGAELLAEGDMFPVQAFRFGSAYALQFHAEVTHLMMCRWTTRGHERTLLPGAKRRPEHFADRPVYDPAVRRWLVEFLDRWIDGRTPASMSPASMSHASMSHGPLPASVAAAAASP